MLHTRLADPPSPTAAGTPDEAPSAFADEARLLDVLENLADAFCALDPEWRFAYLNAAAERLAGRPRAELLGRRIWDLYPGLAGSVLGERLQQARLTGEAVEFEHRHEAPGRVLDIRLHPSDAGLGVHVRDVTAAPRVEAQGQELLRAHAARQAAEVGERRARFLSEASALLGSSLDYDQSLANLARLLVPTLGDYSIIDMVDERTGEVRRVEAAHADPELEPLARGLVRHPPVRERPGGVSRVLRTGQPLLITDVTDAVLEDLAQGPDHLDVLRRLHPTCFLIVPLQARGRTLGAITVARTTGERTIAPGDIALARELADRAALAIDNARLHRAAEQASKGKSAFLSMMSHELRTPLTAVVAYTEMLAGGLAGPLSPRQRDHIGHIADGASHVLGIIEEFLSYARMEAGELTVKRRQVDVCGVARDALGVVEPLAAEKSLRLEARLPDGAVVVDTDPGKLRQVLVNLLSNAIKYTREGGVELALAAEPGGVTLTVTDSGIGIAEEQLRSIFEPYWQVEESERVTSGSGLGLAIVARLVEMLGGTVGVESAVGRGSRFAVRLPA